MNSFAPMLRSHGLTLPGRHTQKNAAGHQEKNVLDGKLFAPGGGFDTVGIHVAE